MEGPNNAIDLSLYYAIKNQGREHFNKLGKGDGWLEFIGELMAYLDSIQAELKEEIKVNNLLKN